MSGVPFYKKAATQSKQNFDWPPKRVQTVKVSREEPKPEVFSRQLSV